MIGFRAQRRSEGNVVGGLEQILVTVKRPNPLVLLWRWRYEVGLLLGIGLPVAALVQNVGAAATIALTSAVALTIGIGLTLSPRARQLAVDRAWCVITPHRVRTACAQARIHSRNGRLPFVLLTSRAPHGERVLLWCRAGTSVEDFVAARPLIVAACWASEVRVKPSRRHAQLVILDVVHGEPAPNRPAADPPGEYLPAPADPPPSEPLHPRPLPTLPRPRQPAHQ